ncbi:unnamed protein product [Ascophyllum nodosum]
MELFFTEREEEGNGNGGTRRRSRLLSEQALTEEEWEGDGETGEGSRRGLGECVGGFWSLAPTGSGYPRLVVGDCAEHPADIKVTTWSNKTCATCDEEVYTGAQPEISCFEDGSTVGVTSTTTSSSSIGDGSGSGSGSGTGEGGGSGDESSATPVPTPVGDEDAVASPEAAVDDDDDDDDGDDNSEGDGCMVLEVGGSWAGLYTMVGSYNDHGDFYSESLAHNIFFEYETASTEDDDGDDGGDDRRRSLTGLFRKHAEELKEDTGEGKGRRLASCDTGYWIKTPTGGGYPFFAVADCASNPEDISSSSVWQIVDCNGCTASPADSNQPVACATGVDAIVTTPSPVGPFDTVASHGDALPGAGPSTCEAVTVTGPRGGSYTVVGEKNNHAELHSDDGEWEFFYAGAAPALQRMRRRLDGGEGGQGSPLSRVSSRDLQTTCNGYWYITPVDTRYPAYVLSDCAYHPVDIVETDWLIIDCEDCEVETASSKPEATCTGAPENAKRGGSFVTPAPTPDDPNRTPAPVSSFICETTCSDLVVTGDFTGNYSANGTYRGKMDFFSEDGRFNLYFELAADRRLLQETEMETETRLEVFPGDVMASALRGVVGASRNLALCSTGYWIIAEIGGNGYPVFGVPDCAQHPADIRGNPWLVTSCESCGVEEAPSYVAPTVSCAAGSEMSPAATSPTASPAPASPASCQTVYVTGPAAGVYGQRGDYGDRGDFHSNNEAWNLYWVFYAGKPVNRNRFRRGLSMPGGVSDQTGDRGRWSEKSELALQSLAAELRGHSLEGKGELRHHHHLTLEVEVEIGEGNAATATAIAGGAGLEARRLEFCEDGFWLITPRGGGFPFYGTQNCADHPADISPSASWSVVECDGCGSQPTNATFVLTCDGDGFTPPPSPTSTTPTSSASNTPSTSLAPNVGEDVAVGPSSLAPVAGAGREVTTTNGAKGAWGRHAEGVFAGVVTGAAAAVFAVAGAALAA